MVLVPLSGSTTATTGMPFAKTCSVASEAHACVVPGVLPRPESPLALELTLPATVQTLAFVGIPVPEKALLADADSAIPPVVIRHHHLRFSQEGSRTTHGSPRARDPVYERPYQSRFFLHCFYLSFVFPCFT